MRQKPMFYVHIEVGNFAQLLLLFVQELHFGAYSFEDSLVSYIPVLISCCMDNLFPNGVKHRRLIPRVCEMVEPVINLGLRIQNENSVTSRTQNVTGDCDKLPKLALIVKYNYVLHTALILLCTTTNCPSQGSVLASKYKIQPWPL